jgi:hypothetical protein
LGLHNQDEAEEEGTQITLVIADSEEHKKVVGQQLRVWHNCISASLSHNPFDDEYDTILHMYYLR